MTEITLPLPPGVTLAIGVMLAFALVSLLVVLTMTLKSGPKREKLSTVQNRLGLKWMHPALFFGAAMLWGSLFLLLILSLIFTIFDFFWSAYPELKDQSGLWSWRFAIVKLTALTTVTAAVLALPFTLIRLNLTREQTRTATESLFNDKINAATTDLYSQRQVSRWTRYTASNGWEDDVIRRNAAIDRLEGLVEERPDTAQRVARMLGVYVRELSRQYAPQKPPDTTDVNSLRKWAGNLKPARSDMEKAVQTLGRLAGIPGVDPDHTIADLSGANLQGFTLPQAALEKANLSGARLQGANLSRARLQGANLFGARLQGANLTEARLQGADLRVARLQGANLIEARLQGADLRVARLQGADLIEARLQGADLRVARLQGANLIEARLQGADLGRARLQGADLGRARFDPSTSLSAAMPAWAALREVDFTNIPQITEHLNVMFGDRSVILPGGPDNQDYPAHWPKEVLNWDDFYDQWRAWQRENGYTPDNPQ